MHAVFNEKALDCVVKMIAAESKTLLEIVNFNVQGEQYVCAGSVSYSTPYSTLQQN